MFVLHNPIRDYAWGSPDAIPRLLGLPATGAPAAELWMGAHPGAPSTVAEPVPDGAGAVAGQSLTDLIKANPQAMLGPVIADRFGARLPFLFKVLAAAKPLSLQAHPSPGQAVTGFAAEQAAGVPIDAAHRNYRDDQAKPELVCALTEFDALCGFAPADVAAARLVALGVPALSALAAQLRTDPVDQALPNCLAALLDPATGTAAWVSTAAATGVGATDRSLALLPQLAEYYPSDPGVLVSLLLNFVTLQPGQALYLPAGNIHAYVRGLAVELMTASDNVLRAGLTPKHVDVPELLRVLDPRPHDAEPLTAQSAGPFSAGLATYRTPATTFELSRIDAPMPPARLPAGSIDVPAGPQILFTASGSAAVTDAAGHRVELTTGRSLFGPWADGALTLNELAAGTTVFRAALPR